MYLRPDYYNAQNEKVHTLIADLITENGKDYNEALNEAYIRIYQSIDPSYVPNTELAVDKICLNIPAADVVMFSRARKFLLEAMPKNYGG